MQQVKDIEQIAVHQPSPGVVAKMLTSKTISMNYSRMSHMKKRSLTVVIFVTFLGPLLLMGLIVSADQASVQPASGKAAEGRPVSIDAATVSSSQSSSQDIDATEYWTEERMRSARPAEELVSEPDQSDQIRPAEQSSKMKVTESFSHPVRPKPLLGHQTGNAVVPEMTGTVLFNYDGEGGWYMVLLTRWMEGH